MSKKGYKQTKEHRKKISEVRKGYQPSERQLENLKLGPQNLKGKKRSDDVRKAISIGNKGKPKSPEHCKALSLAHMGNKPTDETKKKMSKSHIGLLKGHKYAGTIIVHHMDLCHGKKDPLSLVKMLFEDHSKMHNALRLINSKNRWLMQFDILNSISKLRKNEGEFCPIYV